MPVIRRRGVRGPVLAVTLLVGLAACTFVSPVEPAPGRTGSAASAGPAALPTPRSTRSPTSLTSPTSTSTTTLTVTVTSAPTYRVGATVSLPVGVAPGASGLAPTGTPGTWYVQDDARGTAEVVEVTSAGRLVRRIPLAGMAARNAEALATGRCAASAQGCLFVGDIGDNLSQRSDVVVYVATMAALKALSGKPVANQAWHYTYPDTPHDAEALLVAPDGTVLILTKSTPDNAGKVAPHRIYRGRPGGGTLTLVGQYSPPAPAIPLQSLLTGTVVTDASYDGRRLLLLTYDEVIAYTAPTPDADPAGFPRWPHVSLPHPPLVQTEGISGLADGCGYIVASEEGPGGSQSALATVSCGR